jgi:gliding motility-associated-like protein
MMGQCNFTKGPVGELCTSAIYICGSEMNGYKATMPNNKSVHQPWNALCNGNGNIDNIVWYSFTPCQKKVTIEITVTNCTVVNGFSGVQAGLFKGCKENLFLDCSKSPDSNDGDGLKGTFRVSSDKFEPGEPGFFYLDGYSGSVCDFTLKVIEGIDTSRVTPPDRSKLALGAITGPDLLKCQETSLPFRYNLTKPECDIKLNSACGNNVNIVNPADSTCYVWSIYPTTGRRFLNNDSTGTNTDIIFSAPGEYTISAQTYLHPFYGGSCANAACGDIISWKVVVMAPDTIDQPDIIRCPGEVFDFFGQSVSQDTTLYHDFDTCTVYKYKIIFKRSITNNMGVQYVCAGQSFDFQDNKYQAGTGTIQVVDKTDCRLTHIFSVEQVNLGITISNNFTEINCGRPQLQVKAIGNTNGTKSISYQWHDQNNITVGNSESLTISKAGRYFATAIYDVNGLGCKASTSVDITGDFKKPTISATIPTLRCLTRNEANPTINLSTQSNLSSTQWTSPSGKRSSGMTIQLDSTEVVSGKPYIFSAIGVNGCQLDTTFTVSSNFQQARITLQGDSLTCYSPKDTLQLSTNVIVDSIRWYRTLPQEAFYGSSSDKLTHIVDEAGIYKVEVRAADSKCWSTQSIEIENKIIYPDFRLNNDLKWQCNTQSIVLTPEATPNPSVTYEWSTTNGKILSQVGDKVLKAGAPGSYTLRLLNKSNGCDRSGNLIINRETNVPIDIQVSTTDISCFGRNDGKITLNNVVGGIGPYTFLINNSPVSQKDITNLSKGNYTITTKDVNDCVYQKNISIVEPEVLEIETPLEIFIAFNETRNLTFSTNYPDSKIADIKWTNSKGNLLGDDFEIDYSSLVNDVIKVEIKTINGCEASATIRVLVENELKFFLPNAFSPNNDGRNDKLVLFKNRIPITLNHIAIYDRYGNMVYHTNSYDFNDENQGWDGKWNGNDSETGVYVLLVEFIDFLGQKQIIKRDVTLIR